MAEPFDLSEREEQVARLLLEGKSNKQIAAALKISISTVEFHLTNLYSKMGVGSRSEAIVQLNHLGKTRDDAQPGKFPVENEAVHPENQDEAKPNKKEKPAMTSSPERHSGHTQTQIWIGILIGLGLFAGYLYLHRGSPLPEPLRMVVTPVATAAPTRTIRPTLTRTAAFTATPLEGFSIDIRLGKALPSPLSRHSMTRLADGKILIAGGSSGVDVHLNSAWIYDPYTDEIYPAASMNTPRHGHTATLLNDGRVLVVGGYNATQAWLQDAEIYDPVVDAWTVIPPVYPHGVEHTATLLPDGRVLVVGGCIGSSNCTNRVELFDPQTNSWTEAAPLNSERSSQTANLLNDGRVLIAGGDWDEQGNIVDGTAVLYDPATNRWSQASAMITPRVQAESVQLPDGKVLVAGGIMMGSNPPQIISKSEIYDPQTNTWTAAGELGSARYAFNLFLLPNGRAVAAGGARDYEDGWGEGSFVHEVEMYNLQLNRWEVAGQMDRPTALAAGVLMPDGQEWISGGQSGRSEYSLESFFIGLSASQ